MQICRIDSERISSFFRQLHSIGVYLSIKQPQYRSTSFTAKKEEQATKNLPGGGGGDVGRVGVTLKTKTKSKIRCIVH